MRSAGSRDRAVHQQRQQFALAIIQPSPHCPADRIAALQRREGRLPLRLVGRQVIEAVDQLLARLPLSPATRLVRGRHPEPAGQPPGVADVGGVDGEAEPGLLHDILDLRARAEVAAGCAEWNLPMTPNELVERVYVAVHEGADELVGPK